LELKLLHLQRLQVLQLVELQWEIHVWSLLLALIEMHVMQRLQVLQQLVELQWEIHVWSLLLALIEMHVMQRLQVLQQLVELQWEIHV
jgi:hypothetical protein